MLTGHGLPLAIAGEDDPEAPRMILIRARTRTRHGTYLRWCRHCLVTRTSSAMASCGGAWRRPTGFCYGRSYGALKSSEGAQAHCDDDCVLDEASWGRGCLQDQESRRWLARGNRMIAPAPSSPGCIAIPKRSTRWGEAPRLLRKAWNGLHRRLVGELRRDPSLNGGG
jgi:hypothetical protein